VAAVLSKLQWRDLVMDRVVGRCNVAVIWMARRVGSCGESLQAPYRRFESWSASAVQLQTAISKFPIPWIPMEFSGDRHLQLRLMGERKTK